MPILIRKSRLTITKRNHRYVGVKVGQLVYYWWADKRGGELRKYRVSEIEDCYDWSKKSFPKRQYNRYIWLKPVKTTGPMPKAVDRIHNVMKHNNKLWNAGHIGHGVDYTEIFFTPGEALHSCMKGCY